MKHNELIEVVARAIDPEVFLRPRINLYRADYERVYSQARAALSALGPEYRIVPAEPTEAMLRASESAIVKTMKELGWSKEQRSHRMSARTKAVMRWQAMIAAVMDANQKGKDTR